MKNNSCLINAFLILILWCGCIYADEEHDGTGKVNSIDYLSRTLNITHNAIYSLGMLGMTMDFRVVDPAMLDDVKPGQTINFVVATDRRGYYVLLDVE